MKQKKVKKQQNEKSNEETKEEVTKEDTNTENTQAIVILAVIVLIFVAFFGTYFAVKSQKTFEYANVTWDIDKEETITFYHTLFEKRFNNKSYGFHNTYLRNDPRKNNVPIEVTKLAFYTNIGITTDPALLNCDKQILVTDALIQITAALPLYNKQVTSAISNKTIANETQRQYLSCNDKPEKMTLINVKKGDANSITEDKENKCYTLTIENCEDNLLVAERFITEIITQLQH